MMMSISQPRQIQKILFPDIYIQFLFSVMLDGGGVRNEEKFHWFAEIR